MIPALALVTSVFCTVVIAAPPTSVRQSYAKLAPYSAVRWEGDTPEVLVDGTWYELAGIDKVGAADLVTFCKKEFRDRWRKRIAEDLVEALARMGHPAGGTVDLQLTALDTGVSVTLTGVSMTAEKRNAVWRAAHGSPVRNGVAPSSRSVKRTDREHASRPDPAFAHLAQPVRTEDAPRTIWLTREEAEEDLDELEWHLATRFSYWDLKGIDQTAAFDAVRAGLGARIERSSFTIQLMKLLALFGDGHTRIVENDTRTLPRGYAPFLVGDVGGRLVAFHPDRSGFLDSERPYLAAIDGLPVERWLAVAAALAADGSPQFQKRHAARNLRFLQYLRREMGLKETGTVELSLAGDTPDARSLTLPVADRKPIYGSWPRPTGHRLLEGDFGYLRIPAMADDTEFLTGLHRAMESFADTNGLVIDVRGNGGGSRDALRLLFPYFMRADDPPYVANVAAYRLPGNVDSAVRGGYLANRALHPAGARVFDEAARASVLTLAASFVPEWTPPAGAFSAWHYLVLRPDPALKTYERPVVVLVDGGCFSATDIFLGAFAGWRNVTLLGEPSGGGSGRSQTIVLAHSGIRLKASTMASFRRDGRMYDGNGIAPDVLAPREPSDFLGTTDTQLEAALALLSGPR